MSKYICSVCGYTYDEAAGDPERGIAPGTRFEDLPSGFVCPWCGASKSEFKMQGAESEKPAAVKPMAESGDMRELTALETSALLSNLAKGCEKQYKQDEAELFTKLSEFFGNGAAKPADASMAKLVGLVEKDLAEGFPSVNLTAAEAGDRGALRALVWSEKVTKILRSLLARYEKEGDAMLENTGVYVCTICGFVFIGNEPPALCPVCKVPSYKFKKIEGRAK